MNERVSTLNSSFLCKQCSIWSMGGRNDVWPGNRKQQRKKMSCKASWSAGFPYLLHSWPYNLSISLLYVSICILKMLCSPDHVSISASLDTAQAVVPAPQSDTSHQCFPTFSQLRQLFCCDMCHLPTRSSTSTPLNGMQHFTETTRNLWVSCHSLSKEHRCFSWW